MTEINEILMKKLLSLNAMQKFKEIGILNPLTAKMLLTSDPATLQGQLENIEIIAKMTDKPFKNPEKIVNGPIVLATAENKNLIGLYPEECHALIAGQTGMGKTTLLRLIFSQALSFGLNIWLFVKAKDTRDLIDVNNKTLINNFDGNMKINPLNPCGIPESDYCNIFTDIFIQSQRLYDGTKNYLIEHLNTLYKIHKENNSIPAMHDLYFYIRSLKHPGYSRTASYRESALNRLGGIIYGTLGKAFDCSKGHEESLLNYNCIFEIDTLSTEQQIFMVNILLIKLFNHRLSNNTNNWTFVGIDDGNLIFDASLEKRPDLGLPIIHHLLSTVRKSKINMFCCTQAPHQLGSSIHSNSAVKIMFNLANGNDIDFMHKSIGNLSEEQKEFCYGLDKGQIIIKNSLRFPEPVFGVVPEIPDTREVTDIEAIQNNELILSSFPEVIPRYVPEEKTEPETVSISDNIKEFLMVVNLNQYKKTLTEIYNLGNFSAGTGSRVAKDCEKKNLIKIIQVPFGRGRPRYPVLLPEAYKLLNIKEKKFYGKGAGFEHILTQHLIAEHFSDYKPEIELNRNNKFIDIAINTNELLIAIEVAMTSVHEKANIEKDFEKAKADFVIVACKDKKALNAVEKIVSNMPEKNKTKVLLVSELLNKKPDEFIDGLHT